MNTSVMRNVQFDMNRHAEAKMNMSVKRKPMGRVGRRRGLALAAACSHVLYFAACGTAGAAPGHRGRRLTEVPLAGSSTGSRAGRPEMVVAQGGGAGAPSALARPDALTQALRTASQLEVAHRYAEAASALVKAAWLSAPADRSAPFIRAAGLYERASRVDMAIKCLGEAARFGGAYVRVYTVSGMDRLSVRLVGRRSVLWLLRGAGAKSVLAGVMAPLNADYWRIHGNPGRAVSILKRFGAAMRVVAALRRQGMVGLPRRLGCLVSLKGWYHRVSQSVLHGALLALDLYARRRVWAGSKPWNLYLSDISTKGAFGVDMARFDGRVSALLGPVDPKMAKVAAARAHALGVPMVAISPSRSVATTGPRIFDYLPVPQQRIRALSRALAKALGVEPLAPKGSGVTGGAGGTSESGSVGRRRQHSGHGPRRHRLVAVIVPKTTSGAAMAATAVSVFGQNSVLVLQYERRQTTFGDLISKMKRAHVKGVVAAVSAWTLELLATQMAAAGLWAGHPPGYQPPGRRMNRRGRRWRRRRRRRRGRWVTMAATADGLKPKRFGRITRYLQGALLCPGFYPSPQDRRWGAFVRDYQRTYGSLPDAVAAYAYEAASLVRLGVELGHVEGGDLAAWLARAKQGGRPIFDANGRLVRPSQIYRVTGGKLVVFAAGAPALHPRTVRGTGGNR